MAERPYEKLIAWQEAYRLCLSIYKLTAVFPVQEKFALVDQMRRAAYSAPMNIAEGNAKRSKKDRAHFCEIALGSLEELHCQCKIALGLSYTDQAQFNLLDDHIQRVSYLVNRLRTALL